MYNNSRNNKTASKIVFYKVYQLQADCALFFILFCLGIARLIRDSRNNKRKGISQMY